MATVVLSHAVGNMETWLRSGDHRKAVFAKFCSNYRIFRHVDANRVSIVCENVDLAKMSATLSSPETAKSKAADTVIDPVRVYLEVVGAE